MKALQEDIDDLDKMVDGNAQTDKIRSQIRLVAREVAALEAEFASLAKGHAELQAQHSQLQDGLKHLDAKSKRELDDWLQQQSNAYRQVLKRHTLNHSA